jgi:hypothetical protein
MEFRFKLYDQLDQVIIASGEMSHQMADTLNREFVERNEFKIWVIQ